MATSGSGAFGLTLGAGHRALIGVLHLLPLPGAPRPSPGLEVVSERAVRDACALLEGGADAMVVENLGDAPFGAGRVAPFTVAAMTRVALAVRAAVPDLPMGINVLRNDAASALAIASAVGARFIRVNVHVGAMVTDQGLVQGDAQGTLLERNRLGAPVAIAADVLVKHAVPLGPTTLEDAARDTVHRGLADAVIVSGTGTGQPTDPNEVARVRAAVPDARVWVGSGCDPDRAPALLVEGGADALVVGTWLHEDGDLEAPLAVNRVRRMRSVIDALPRRRRA